MLYFVHRNRFELFYTKKQGPTGLYVRIGIRSKTRFFKKDIFWFIQIIKFWFIQIFHFLFIQIFQFLFIQIFQFLFIQIFSIFIHSNLSIFIHSNFSIFIYSNFSIWFFLVDCSGKNWPAFYISNKTIVYVYTIIMGFYIVYSMYVFFLW